jgi:putative RNA 2'-phosphotransferase
MTDDLVKISKFLSLVLRHKPQQIGLALDEHGWADVDDLIRCANEAGHRLTRPLLEQVVAQNDKQRFALSEDRRRIRANQGHSVPVDLDLPPCQPPDTLYHGTATQFVDSIREQGLGPGQRQHVHLSPDVASAVTVGQRHGKPVILPVRAREMWQAGYRFYRSPNHVWLTDGVPAEFIDFPS